MTYQKKSSGLLQTSRQEGIWLSSKDIIIRHDDQLFYTFAVQIIKDMATI